MLVIYFTCSFLNQRVMPLLGYSWSKDVEFRLWESLVDFYSGQLILGIFQFQVYAMLWKSGDPRPSYYQQSWLGSQWSAQPDIYQLYRTFHQQTEGIFREEDHWVSWHGLHEGVFMMEGKCTHCLEYHFVWPTRASFTLVTINNIEL